MILFLSSLLQRRSQLRISARLSGCVTSFVILSKQTRTPGYLVICFFDLWLTWRELEVRKSLITLRSHSGTWDFLSPLKYRLMTITERNVDSVISIMFRQKYAPEEQHTVWISLFLQKLNVMCRRTSGVAPKEDRLLCRLLRVRSKRIWCELWMNVERLT